MPGDGYRFLNVPPLTRSTTDALVKRDVGTLATTADWVFYLCDDHAVRTLTLPIPDDQFDVCVPGRVSQHHQLGLVRLNMGMDANDPNRPYCGGHAGLFRRSLIQQRPWTAMPHDRLWDLRASQIQVAMGARFVESDAIVVQDLEPGAEPWK